MPECKQPATPNGGGTVTPEGEQTATPNGDQTDIVKSGWDKGQLAICCTCTFPRDDNQ
jgi:hypothetical protein